MIIFTDGFDVPAKWQADEDYEEALKMLSSACMYLIDAPAIDAAALKILRRSQRRMIAERATEKPIRDQTNLEIPFLWLRTPAGNC